MQVMPRGQKKPSQQGWQSTDLTGISFLLLLMSTFWLALQPHPGSHPLTHELKLQFMLGFKKLDLLLLELDDLSPVAKLRAYASISPAVHMRCVISPKKSPHNETVKNLIHKKGVPTHFS